VSNELHQNWEQEGLAIRLSVHSDKPFPQKVWQEDLPHLATLIELLRLHLGGDM
jgi:hypothetical protein